MVYQHLLRQIKASFMIMLLFCNITHGKVRVPTIFIPGNSQQIRKSYTDSVHKSYTEPNHTNRRPVTWKYETSPERVAELLHEFSRVLKSYVNGMKFEYHQFATDVKHLQVINKVIVRKFQHLRPRTKSLTLKLVNVHNFFQALVLAAEYTQKGEEDSDLALIAGVLQLKVAVLAVSNSEKYSKSHASSTVETVKNFTVLLHQIANKARGTLNSVPPEIVMAFWNHFRKTEMEMNMLRGRVHS